MNHPLGIGNETYATEAFENRAQAFDDALDLFGRASRHHAAVDQSA